MFSATENMETLYGVGQSLVEFQNTRILYVSIDNNKLVVK